MIRRELSERQLAFWLLLPAVLLLALVVVYPVSRLLYTSLFDYSMGPVNPPFIGMHNYLEALRSSEVINALKVTGLYVLVTVPGGMILGLILALLANLPFRVKWPVRLSLLLPWSMSMAFAALIFAWFFNSDYGVINDVIRRFGFAAPNWLSAPGFAFFATCFAIIWKTSSFVALILLAGLQTIPKEMYEAADVDGARAWTKFWRITLPLLKPALIVAVIFRTITAIQTFDVPYIMTSGGPGDVTTTIAMVIHEQTLQFGNFGFGAAIAVLLFLLSLIITSFYLRHIRGDAE
ncbi:carbohydrate ABC transporter permease [Deinococcus peraridilitoris]|uniref:Permease component of ABC-type sugar transporter n=1 Tax=Deinococcus peraridilitoris (strain DSM 19664 / LMG 22246 / CIP 109416 / KR-200) TaxID=937777 RepID=L0A826_DEIPD|nr:sugar ABC transporter permease [Deinococcus peraridilitoris]AFZ69337.1 permease component of ABC-type sugar transporter [Deinococcus peraridilitoris DSM 19664]